MLNPSAPALVEAERIAAEERARQQEEERYNKAGTIITKTYKG